MARRALRLAWVAGVAVAALGLTLAVRRLRHDGASRVESSQVVMAPAGVRVRVQVMNATTTRGLARRATMLLRDRGFDVVESGTASEQLDSTLVLDRSGHPDWSQRVAAALGGARVEARPDSSRYMDVTVLLGR